MLARSPLLALYQPHLVHASLVLSFQTVAEMRYGALKAHWGEERSQNLEQFFSFFDLALYTDDLATHWAQIMFDARQAGRRLEAGDAWIAATASLLKRAIANTRQGLLPARLPVGDGLLLCLIAALHRAVDTAIASSHPKVTTVPFSHDSIAASMMSWALSASSPEPSISSGRAPARFCSTQRPMRLGNVSLKPIMPPR